MRTVSWMISWIRGLDKMITTIDIIRAVSDWIEGLFGEPPTTKDVTEGFTRPCTYVQPSVLDTAVEGGLRHDTVTLEVIRFAPRTRKGWLELLEYQSKLTDALEAPIPVDEKFFLYPDAVSVDLRRDEMLLMTTFTVENFQLRPADDAVAEDMEILTLTRKD